MRIRPHHLASLALTCLCLSSLTTAPPAASQPGRTTLSAEEAAVVSWPESQRAFFQDGPGLLLSPAERQDLLALDEAGREKWIEAFLDHDPIPETPENELREGISRRERLAEELPSPRDVRARLLFLNGKPAGRQVVDCSLAFRPLEIWTYPDPDGGGEPRQLVVYQPGPGEAWRLWLPLDSKRALYTSEMEYWLEQWQEGNNVIFRARRFDLQVCKEAREVDRATGVEALTGYKKERPTQAQIERFLAAPDDLATWARAAAATELPPAPPALAIDKLEIQFPEKRNERIVTRALIVLPPKAGYETVKEGDKEEVHLAVEGIVEQAGKTFDEFKVRFKLVPPAPGVPLALAVDRALRPDRGFVLRLRLRDETSGAEARLSRSFEVPREPVPVATPPVPEETMIALGQELSKKRIAGKDSLLLVPPENDVVLGLYRAEALVTGSRIQKVVFLVDGEPQLTRTNPPWTAELRLSHFPTEQTIRAEGYDGEGKLVASDEVVLNQPRGALRVRILEPARGRRVSGKTVAKAEIVVPEERKIDRVEFRLNKRLVATLEHPPWEVPIEVPTGGEVTYLAVAAYLDDGTRAEDVRFLNNPQFLEEVDVQLVELYTTVNDRSGQLVRGLTQDDFEVFEDGRKQKISKFELVENLPLSVCITIDTSGSMVESLPEAKRAAKAFLANVVRRRGDRAFAVAFADKPTLLIAPTEDVTAVSDLLDHLQAAGSTTLHDAIVTSLYYFRGVRGQRAMVVLSDGDDTASSIPFRDALEYARRSGVAIFTIGLDVGKLNLTVHNKLNDLAQSTGGRTFFISKAEELSGVYHEIEQELRSRYLLAYASDQPTHDGKFREVEVKVKRRGLKARTIRGYYP